MIAHLQSDVEVRSGCHGQHNVSAHCWGCNFFEVPRPHVPTREKDKSYNRQVYLLWCISQRVQDKVQMCPPGIFNQGQPPSACDTMQEMAHSKATFWVSLISSEHCSPTSTSSPMINALSRGFAESMQWRCISSPQNGKFMVDSMSRQQPCSGKNAWHGSMWHVAGPWQYS